MTGPVRTPRRSERYPSLVRIDTINGAPADTVSEGTRYEDLPVAYPSERLALGSEDPTLEAIEWLTPLGRGSRAVIVGAAHAGKTETLRRLLAAVSGRGDIEVTLVLAGSRPEEMAQWQEGPVAPVAALSFAASADSQGQAVERAVDAAKRVAARGGHALVLIDSLDGLHPHAARKALAAARKLRDGGSLTVIATATRPFGGETTVIALDVAHLHRPAADPRPGQQRHAQARAARRGGWRPGDHPGTCDGAGGGRLAAVGDPAPRGLGRQLDRLAAAGRSPIGGLYVGEAAGLLVEGDVQLALVHALVQPRAAEHEAAQPVHQRTLRRSDQLGPAVVDVLAQR